MTTNSQLSTNEPKRKRKSTKTKTKQTTRTGTESQKWRVISGEVAGRMGKKVQGIRSINGSYKIDRGMLRIVQ